MQCSLTSGCANDFRPRQLFQSQSDGEFYMQKAIFSNLPCPGPLVPVEKNAQNKPRAATRLPPDSEAINRL
jgi:hypothetical protein